MLLFLNYASLFPGHNAAHFPHGPQFQNDLEKYSFAYLMIGSPH